MVAKLDPFLLGTKEQLTKENEEWKQKSNSLEEQKTELEVRMSALKSQYEGRESSKSGTMNSEMNHQNLQIRYRICLDSCMARSKPFMCLVLSYNSFQH